MEEMMSRLRHKARQVEDACRAAKAAKAIGASCPQDGGASSRDHVLFWNKLCKKLAR